MATSVSSSATVPASDRSAKLAAGEVGLPRTGLPTPETSLEPEQIPDGSENESDRNTKHANLISHIQNTSIDNPFIFLRVKALTDLNTRVPRMKNYLERMNDPDSRSALASIYSFIPNNIQSHCLQQQRLQAPKKTFSRSLIPLKKRPRESSTKRTPPTPLS